MACENCDYPMHEQFERYKGRWICFRPGPSIGRTICQTPVSDYNNIEAHKQKLAEAKVPKWCPGAKRKEVSHGKGS